MMCKLAAWNAQIINKIKMNFGNFLYQFHQETRKRIRELLEKLYKQLSKSKNAVAFNKTCLNENILPKFSNINIYIYYIHRYIYIYLYIYIIYMCKKRSKRNMLTHTIQENAYSDALHWKFADI